MLSNDRNEFNKTLMEMFAVYYKQPEQATYSLWWNAFIDYPIEDIRNAFSSYMRKVTYPPTPAGVMQLMDSKIHDVLADEAWSYVPKNESESGYVTARMMQALGVAEELIASGDLIGARLAFTRTYDSLDSDNDFYYSEAYGVPYEEKEQQKIDSYKLLENKGWMTKEKLLMLMPKRLHMIENGLSKTQIESREKQVSKLRLITNTMLNSSQSDTGHE